MILIDLEMLPMIGVEWREVVDEMVVIEGRSECIQIHENDHLLVTTEGSVDG